jgi:hypothetical protein
MVIVLGGGRMFTPAKRLIMMGRWYKNLVTNGNFSNGTAGWTNIDAVVDGVAEKTATFQYNAGISTIPNPESRRGHIVYARGTVKSDSNKVNLNVTDGVNVSFVTHSGDNTFKQLSLIKTVSATATLLYLKIQDDRVSGWTKYYFDNCILVDLTELFGVGNEPTKEWCDANIYPFIIW